MPARDTDLVAYMRNAGRVGPHTDNSRRFHRTVVALAAEHRTRFHKLNLATRFMNKLVLRYREQQAIPHGSYPVTSRHSPVFRAPHSSSAALLNAV